MKQAENGQQSTVGVMDDLVRQHQDKVVLPVLGEIISGTIIDKSRNALYIDLGALGVGVIYGHDLFDDIESFRKAKLGDRIQASIQRYDNEDNCIELSLRSATRERSWDDLRRKLESGEVLQTEILDANKGGLIIRLNGILGFLPVSQLSPDHYPRVEGADKSRILDRLREYIGERFRVKVIGATQESEKLIVSEKAVISDEMSEILDKLHIGTVIAGTISGVVDFGVFVKFALDGKELEGLIHISELAWQRIDDPADYVQPGQAIEAKVIGVEGLRISLSRKQLQDDPWKGVSDKYTVGDTVSGMVIKVTPFGGFIKLDHDIHGLVHLSELPEGGQKDPNTILKVGSSYDFRIISLEPGEHRLGLSLRPAAAEDIETSDKQPKN